MSGWHPLKNNVEEAVLSGFHLRLDTTTGKGELQPGGWYSSFAPDGPATTDECRAALVQAGYDKIAKMLVDYRTDALAMGYVVDPVTVIG